MLLYASGNRQDIWIENNVLRWESHLVDKHTVGAFADLNLALESISLSLFIEGHDDRSGSVGAYEARLFLEFVRPLLQAYRVDDALALHTSQARFEHLPF